MLTITQTGRWAALTVLLLAIACGDDQPSDQNGAGSNGPLTLVCSDASSEHNSDDDSDGFTECEGDCDDTDATFYPGAPDEEGDQIDNGCDNYNPTHT